MMRWLGRLVAWVLFIGVLTAAVIWAWNDNSRPVPYTPMTVSIHLYSQDGREARSLLSDRFSYRRWTLKNGVTVWLTDGTRLDWAGNYAIEER